MKSKLSFVFIVLIILGGNYIFAQTTNDTPLGGEVIFPKNTEPCLSEAQRADIQLRISNNIEQLKAADTYQEINPEGGHPLFNWPVSQADGFNYNSVWAVSNYVDHDPAYPDQISDYNCGTRSYDTTSGYNHRGFDIILWPFWWKQMDLDQGMNIAASDGQIVDKNDGVFDKNCTFNNDLPNYIILQHSDGSLSGYLHMKNGSLTSKGIGDSVTQGEFLGVIGSSGSSTLPHLHFEVYDSANNLIDPSMGPCNDYNPDSWWNVQKPYYTPAVNAVLTHDNPPIFPACPDPEVTFESDQFDLNQTVHYGLYLKDQQAGSSIHLKITRPDNSIFAEWDYKLVDDYLISYWIWSYTADMDGQWIWEANYMGDLASHTFNVGVLAVEENMLADTTVYPNPLQNTLFIESEVNIVSANIRDVLGRSIYNTSNTTNSISEMDVSTLTQGVYFITLISDENQSKTIKLIKE